MTTNPVGGKSREAVAAVAEFADRLAGHGAPSGAVRIVLEQLTPDELELVRSWLPSGMLPDLARVMEKG